MTRWDTFPLPVVVVMPQTKPNDMSPYGFLPPVEPIDPFIIDMDRLSCLVSDGALGSRLASSLRALGQDPSSDVIRAWWAGTVRESLPILQWRERYASRKTIRTTPSAEPSLRRCTRVVAMVHELHKVGYQRIRAIPQESPSGMYWRCNITYADNVLDDGFTLRDFDIENTGKVAHYTSGQGNNYFDWPDAASMTARQMALAFLDRFPSIGQNGQGRDWLYAGWLTDFLGHMENAEELGLLAFSGDYPPDPKPLNPWMPPPPVSQQS